MRRALALRFALGLAAGALLGAGAALLWLGRHAEEPEAAEAQPSGVRAPAQARAPEEPAAAELAAEPDPELVRAFPNLRLLGDVREPSRARLCDDANWSGAGELFEPAGAGEFAVDGAGWRARSASAQAGLAAWLSACRHAGRPVAIRARGSGSLLARYDPASGYAPEPSPR
jgi:hypothetical protein